MPPDTVAVISVNAGVPAHLTWRHGRLVESAIRKDPVDADTLALSRINLEGDDQADRTVHGGPDKALYVYPAAHLRAWAAEHPAYARVFVPGSIGENLTVEGWTEQDARVGDVWRWGEALVQIAQPRSPCYKLAARSGIPELTRLFELTGRSGWYLRVLRPAPAVPTRAPLELDVVERGPAHLTVAAAVALRRDTAPLELVERALAEPALADSWRGALAHRLEVVRGDRTA
ncbi:MAG TPA: MOSC domain-containing protein [Candidatus Dormibacteraeota bacterium]|nr:MOSC domain-containing protein [Candidatus Dormibacteraeota bacterium]